MRKLCYALEFETQAKSKIKMPRFNKSYLGLNVRWSTIKGTFKGNRHSFHSFNVYDSHVFATVGLPFRTRKISLDINRRPTNKRERREVTDFLTCQPWCFCLEPIGVKEGELLTGYRPQVLPLNWSNNQYQEKIIYHDITLPVYSQVVNIKQPS